MSEAETKNLTLCFQNLVQGTTEEKLKEAVSKIAEPKSVRIPQGKRKEKRSFAFVEFSTEEDMKKVMEQMDKSDLDGNQIIVEIARSKPHTSNRDDKRRRERGGERRHERRRRDSPPRRRYDYSDDYSDDYYDRRHDRRRRRSPPRRRHSSYNYSDDDYDDRRYERRRGYSPERRRRRDRSPSPEPRRDKKERSRNSDNSE